MSYIPTNNFPVLFQFNEGLRLPDMDPSQAGSCIEMPLNEAKVAQSKGWGVMRYKQQRPHERRKELMMTQRELRENRTTLNKQQGQQQNYSSKDSGGNANAKNISNESDQTQQYYTDFVQSFDGMSVGQSNSLNEQLLSLNKDSNPIYNNYSAGTRPKISQTVANNTSTNLNPREERLRILKQQIDGNSNSKTDAENLNAESVTQSDSNRQSNDIEIIKEAKSNPVIEANVEPDDQNQSNETNPAKLVKDSTDKYSSDHDQAAIINLFHQKINDLIQQKVSKSSQDAGVIKLSDFIKLIDTKNSNASDMTNTNSTTQIQSYYLGDYLKSQSRTSACPYIPHGQNGLMIIDNIQIDDSNLDDQKTIKSSSKLHLGSFNKGRADGLGFLIQIDNTNKFTNSNICNDSDTVTNTELPTTNQSLIYHGKWIENKKVGEFIVIDIKTGIWYKERYDEKDGKRIKGSRRKVYEESKSEVTLESEDSKSDKSIKSNILTDSITGSLYHKSFNNPFACRYHLDKFVLKTGSDSQGIWTCCGSRDQLNKGCVFRKCE